MRRTTHDNTQAQLRGIGFVLKTMVILFMATFFLSYITGIIMIIFTREPVLNPLITLAIVMIPFTLGWLIERHQPGHAIALMFLVMAYSTASGHISSVVNKINTLQPGSYATLIDAVTLTIGHVAWIPGVFFPLFLMPLYFPNGKLLSPRWRVLVVIIIFMVTYTLLSMVIRPWPWPESGIPDTRMPNGIAGSEAFIDLSARIFAVLMPMPLFLFIPLSVFLRYRRSKGIERIQMKWPGVTMIIIFFLSLIIWATPELTSIDAANGYTFTWILAMMFPLSMGIAILQYNLFDIDIIINRTLVYGILSVLILILYVMIVSMLGSLVQTQTSVLSGLVATGLIAVIFQPLRDRLQMVVNRVLYGERDDPAAVLSRLAYHLENTDAPTAILPNLVQTIAHALKIPYVAIWLPITDNNMQVAADWGEPPEQREVIALIYQNKIVGQLVVAPRATNEHFTNGERALLATIAALTATTIRAVQLSEELRDSRQRIVTAREEERRRIRRDLHDGLGPQLASQTLGLEAVSQLMPTDPDKAYRLLQSLKEQAHEAILDVRHLVYDLRPPALDDIGLVGALQQSAAKYETDTLRFSFDILQPLPRLPAAVETAIFRISQEAMTNVMRHAHATQCKVSLYCKDRHLIVEIYDNGRGLNGNVRSGVGLQSMNERAAELNGTCVIESIPAGGVRVQASFPMTMELNHE